MFMACGTGGGGNTFSGPLGFNVTQAGWGYANGPGTYYLQLSSQGSQSASCFQGNNFSLAERRSVLMFLGKAEPVGPATILVPAESGSNERGLYVYDFGGGGTGYNALAAASSGSIVITRVSGQTVEGTYSVGLDQPDGGRLWGEGTFAVDHKCP